MTITDAPNAFQTSKRKLVSVSITKPVALTLRLEGGVALVLAAWAYQSLGANWWLFAALFLVPDIFMLGYLRGNRIGAAVYNVGHTYLVPAALALVGVAFGTNMLLPVAIIWAAHIGFDRLMGYGLKSPAGFKVTHLGHNGKA
jgi:hypothetical protein